MTTAIFVKKNDDIVRQTNINKYSVILQLLINIIWKSERKLRIRSISKLAECLKCTPFYRTNHVMFESIEQF